VGAVKATWRTLKKLAQSAPSQSCNFVGYGDASDLTSLPGDCHGPDQFRIETDFVAFSSTVFGLRRALLMAALLVMAFAPNGRADTLASARTKTYQPQTLQITQPINRGQLKQQLYFYACSGADDSEITKVLADAQGYVEKRASEVSKPVLVLDIDETSLSNLPQELASDFGYIKGDIPCDRLPKGPCGFDKWVMSGKAKAIAGTLALFKAVKARNVAVFFITGRYKDEKLRAATVKNLQAAGYEGWAGLVLRPSTAGNMTSAGYKSSERGKIAAQGYTIIVNVGDQQSDLDGGYGERAYKLPKPFYYLSLIARLTARV
jgi:predicted secreted acid phosphatase